MTSNGDDKSIGSSQKSASQRKVWLRIEDRDSESRAGGLLTLSPSSILRQGRVNPFARYPITMNKSN